MSKANLYLDFEARPELPWAPVTSAGARGESLQAPWAWPPGHRVRVCPDTDLFDLAVSDDMLCLVFASMVMAPWHNFFVQTQRPARMRRFVERVTADRRTLGEAGRELEGGRAIGFARATAALVARREGSGCVLPHNIWLGVRFEDQSTADARLPELLRTPAARHWAIASPLREVVDLAPHLKAPTPLRMLHIVPPANEDLAAPLLEQLTGAGAGMGHQLRQAGVPVYLRQA